MKSEIEADKKRGIDTQKQEEDLAEIEQKALKATASQMRTLNEANKSLEEAAKEEGMTDKTDRMEENPDGKVGKPDNEDAQTAGTKGNAAIIKTGIQPAESASVIAAATFKSVDVRL